ncbi:hypothetical protein ACFX11_016976 [Malus domestica]
MILSVLGPDHALKVLFLGIQTKTSQWVTHHRIALARTRLTSEFQWNPKLVSSQKISCYMEVGPDVLVGTLAPNARVAIIPFYHLPDQLSRSTILFALGPNHAHTVSFLGAQMRTSQ